MNATIVALPLALAKSLKAEPVVSGCRFAAPYFPMTHLKAHVSGDRVGRNLSAIGSAVAGTAWLDAVREC
jgi:hypothetical protein